MATRTWNSAASTDMNNGNNYSPTGSILTTDDLVFNATSAVNATATAALSVASIATANYTGVITDAGYAITCTGTANFSGNGANHVMTGTTTANVVSIVGTHANWTIVLTGNCILTTVQAGTTAPTEFIYGLTCADSGCTAYIDAIAIGNGGLNINGGVLLGSIKYNTGATRLNYPSYLDVTVTTNTTPLTMVSGSKFEKNGNNYFNLNGTSVAYTFPSINVTTPDTFVLRFIAGGSGNSLTFSGNITTAVNGIQLYTTNAALTVNLGSYTYTFPTMTFNGATNMLTVNCETATIDATLAGGTSKVTLDLDSCNWTCQGAFTVGSNASSVLANTASTLTVKGTSILFSETITPPATATFGTLILGETDVENRIVWSTNGATIGRLQVKRKCVVAWVATKTYVISNYTSADWNGNSSGEVTFCSTVVGSNYNFTNPASMALAYTNIQDCTPSNVIDCYTSTNTNAGGNHINIQYEASQSLRYWIGGAAGDTTNYSNTNNWSATSGGSVGAGVPSATTNVIFDANSNGYNCTMTANGVAKSITSTGWTKIFTDAGYELDVSTGGMSCAATATWTMTGTLKFCSFGGIITATSWTLNATGSGFTGAGALSVLGLTCGVSGKTTIIVGTLTLANNGLTVGAGIITGSGAITINAVANTAPVVFTAGYSWNHSGSFTCNLNGTNITYSIPEWTFSYSKTDVIFQTGTGSTGANVLNFAGNIVGTSRVVALFTYQGGYPNIYFRTGSAGGATLTVNTNNYNFTASMYLGTYNNLACTFNAGTSTLITYTLVKSNSATNLVLNLDSCNWTANFAFGAEATINNTASTVNFNSSKFQNLYTYFNYLNLRTISYAASSNFGTLVLGTTGYLTWITTSAVDVTINRLQIVSGTIFEGIAGQTYTITNYTLGDWYGSASLPIIIQSGTPGTHWHFTNPAGMVVEHATVTDNYASNEIKAIDSTDGDGNDNWTFTSSKHRFFFIGH